MLVAKSGVWLREIVKIKGEKERENLRLLILLDLENKKAAKEVFRCMSSLIGLGLKKEASETGRWERQKHKVSRSWGGDRGVATVTEAH